MLAKYTEEEIIQLATQNPCFGFVRFGKILYPAKKGEFKTSNAAAEIISIFQEYKNNTGFDLYESLQSVEGLPRVSEAEYKKITGEKFLPNGAGRSTGRRAKRGGALQNTMILPPQEFFWGDIVPEDQRDGHIQERRGMPLNLYLSNVHYDFEEMWNLWMEGCSRSEISRELDINLTTCRKKINLLIELDNNDVLNEWIELINLIKWFISDRNLSSFEEEKNDEVMLFIHSIVDEYIQNPIDNKRPDLKEIISAYREVCLIVNQE